MKDTPAEQLENTEKVKEKEKNEEKLNNIADNLQQLKLGSTREPSEYVEHSSEKVFNNLSDGIGKLNIQPEDSADKEVEKYRGRGPTGGVEVPRHFTHTANKNIPMRPLPNTSFHEQRQYSLQRPAQNKNGRRSLEDAEENEQAHKFMNPDPEQPPPYTCVPPHQQFNCNIPGQNNLSPMQNVAMNLGVNSMGNFLPDLNDETIIYICPNQTTGGKVTVSPGYDKIQDPFTNIKPNIADDLLDEINRQNLPASFPQFPLPHMNMENNFNQQRPQCNTSTKVDYPFSQSQPGRQQEMHSPQRPPSTQRKNLPVYCDKSNDFTGQPFRDNRRFSDPSDSGTESAEEKSPYSDQAPSPADSAYQSPPSVDSGYGGPSPMHETSFPTDINIRSQMPPGMSPPKYHTAYCTAPSPSVSSGYGSPMSQTDDSQDTILGKREEELELALEVIEADINSQPYHLQQNRPSRPAPMAKQTLVGGAQPIFTSTPLGMQMPTTVAMQGQPRAPQHPAMKPNVSVPGIVTTTGVPQQIILLPPQQQANNQPLILVPVNSSGALMTTSTAKKSQGPKVPRKILPKITNPVSSSTGNGTTTTTSTSQSTKSGDMSIKKSPATQANRVTTQHSNAQVQYQNRLLMIARRTVADIPRVGLTKADDENDTYLHIAVCKADRNMVQALLERLHREGLDNLVDQENLKRQTPLYLAVFINQPVMVAMFIKFQANVNVLAQNLSSDGQTTEVKAAIHVAASQGSDYYRTMCELLKANDININIVNNYGQTALHCAILAHGKAKRNSQERINSIDIIKALIKAGADPSAQDKKSGKTPLMYAIEQRNLELVETILCSVDPNKVRNVVRTQAFDGSSCLKIAEGLKDGYDVQIWNKLWNSLQSAANGPMRMQHVY